MPRNNHHPGASSLRNRNRITNKTRLKIHHGNIDADAALIPDEDEEKHRLTNLVAGVDAEDANEHHLQEVLTATHRANAALSRTTRGDKAANAPPPPAFIPTPDSTGVVDNYEALYPLDRWRDPESFVCTSSTVEESIANGIANGFTYYMDERDKEWLDKNNEEARGEGTSAQGAVSSASTTRTSARSAKAKGKEPESPQPVVISEDEFELVMGVFEKVTHDKTEFLHHSLETGMTFPGFSDYQDTFAAPLPANMFANYTVPTWIPPPATLLRIARAIYPYWKERRIERGGHRIIPALNGDESDTLNESYICFRRREIKAVRKTRAQQVSSSEKLTRLQAEFTFSVELAKSVLAREALKKDAAQHAQFVWERRMQMADLKRRFPLLGDKADDELLVDKEKVVKKNEARIPIKIRTHDVGSVPPPRPEVSIRPRDRVAMIRDQVETALARQKDLDHHWDDQIDNVYQAPLIPYTSRYFKFITPPDSDKSEDEPSLAPPRQPRAVRLRYGRGGRVRLDRRDLTPRPLASGRKRKRHAALVGSDSEEGGDGMDVDEEQEQEDVEEQERRRRLEEQWRFDLDDAPGVGPMGADEQDRLLVDDYDSKYLRHTMTLLADPDQQNLMTDPSIELVGPDGRHAMTLPFRLGMAQAIMRRDASGMMRTFHPAIGSMPPPPAAPAQPNGVAPSAPPTPVSHQVKKMPPPNGVPNMRISANGGMRPPLQQQVNGNSAGIPAASSPPHPMALPVSQHAASANGNGASRPAISMPHVDVVKPEQQQQQGQQQGQMGGISIPNGVVTIHAADGSVQQQPESVAVNGTPVRPKSQQMPPNGFHITPMSSHAAAALAATTPNYAQYQNQNNGGQQQQLSLQQVQTLKSAYESMQQSMQQQQGQNQQQQQHQLANQLNRGLPAGYVHVGPNGTPMGMQLPNATHMNLKLPASRQMQWASPMQQQQRPGSAMNGMEGQGMNGISTSPIQGHAVPVRSPSVNGMRVAAGMRGMQMGGGNNGNNANTNGNNNGQMSMSPSMQHSPSPMAQNQSPPRMPMTPTMAQMTSPSLQHQQPIGSSQSGY